MNNTIGLTLLFGVVYFGLLSIVSKMVHPVVVMALLVIGALLNISLMVLVAQ